MPVGSTSLAVVAAVGGISQAYAETALDAANGNKFINDGKTELHVRNTTAGAIVMDFYADTGPTGVGNEVKVASVSIPGSGTNNGVKVLGPFPPSLFNNHNLTEAATTGQVIAKQASAGALVGCALQKNAGQYGAP